MFWRRESIEGPIGLIAGQGEFPLLFSQVASSLKREIILFGLEGYTDKRVENYAKEAHYVQLGSLGRLIELLRQTRIKKVVLAGAVPKKEIYNPQFSLDPAAQAFIRNTHNKGDDHILRAFQFLLKAKCGVSIMDSRLILKDALAARGVMTNRIPTEEEWKDLRFGYKIAKGIGKLDIGQTVVVKQGVVLAVEAMEGTDRAIRRAGELGRDNAVVVKTAKPNQDLRFDLPCVGPQTIESLKAISSHVLGVESGKTVLLFKGKVMEAANRENISIVGL